MRIRSIALAMTLAAAGAGVGFTSAVAQSPDVVPAAATTTAPVTSGQFVRKSKKLQGNWEIVERGGETFVRFDEDFRAARGPDLKVFLSPTSLSDVTGNTAVNGSILLGELTSTRGVQEYRVPAGVNLADYSSVLVHCEEFAVLWGGGTL